MSLAIVMQNRDFTAALAVDVALAVDWLRWEAIGGPASGEIALRGSDDGLVGALDWLRRPVTVFSDGQPVWWGYAAEVSVHAFGYSMGLTLEGMANRVRVRYTDTAGTPAVTAWADETISQAAYGIIEYEEQMSQEEGNSTEAEQRRDRILSQRAWPLPLPMRGQDAPGTGRLTLRGWWTTLAWQYWTQASTGGVENTTQIASIVSAEAPLLTGTDVVNTSGVSGEQERDGTQTALENIVELLTTGTTNDRRLLATVTPERLLRVYEEPASSVVAYNWHRDGRMTSGNALTPLLAGFGPVGAWCKLADLPARVADLAFARAISPFFLEAVEWSAEGGLAVEARDVQSMWDVLGA